ncbi:hypothetical protein IMG5_196660 [Ichthyophthirius multifiliis]|uniref:50S ribosomal protein L13 n=1 Tax=Ichthyophthirius multifiliis TaxID=5932 RepID=G0R572_ICHMU|nr:hypothetical protein IMG5_196660 [Ichthyophthirius multifiliis]EGR27396.1 hypothetical protein IMG5_196660 [Ichthyophthirius multifiliis]|eukprot:XP_004024280.1 hypothetical protein IMG5_196660 [Ichthyophthirius multifiliis]
MHQVQNQLQSLVQHLCNLLNRMDKCIIYLMRLNLQNYKLKQISYFIKQPLGRICQKAAFFLQGKHRPTFRNCDQVTFDNIIIVNAENIVLTGKKALKKTIFYHSGYVGGIKERSYKHYLTQKPEQLIYYCISKMLPKNKKRRDLLQKIRIFRGLQHDHKEFPNVEFNQNIKQNYYDNNQKNIFKKFLPQTKPLVDEKLYNPFLQNIENLVIKYQSAQDTPKEFEGLKKDIDHNFEIPFNQRDKVVKLSAHNIKVFKAWKKYHAKLRRYKIHKIRPPLNRDPNNSRKSILITSEKYIKEHNLGKYIEPEEAPEEDDTIVKSFPKPTKIIY